MVEPLWQLLTLTTSSFTSIKTHHLCARRRHHIDIMSSTSIPIYIHIVFNCSEIIIYKTVYLGKALVQTQGVLIASRLTDH